MQGGVQLAGQYNPPNGAASALLTVLAREPKAVMRALQDG